MYIVGFDIRVAYIDILLAVGTKCINWWWRLRLLIPLKSWTSRCNESRRRGWATVSCCSVWNPPEYSPWPCHWKGYELEKRSPNCFDSSRGTDASGLGFTHGTREQLLCATVKEILDKDGRENPFMDNYPGKFNHPPTTLPLHTTSTHTYKCIHAHTL